MDELMEGWMLPKKISRAAEQKESSVDDESLFLFLHLSLPLNQHAQEVEWMLENDSDEGHSTKK